jgi:hypothetical protein
MNRDAIRTFLTAGRAVFTLTSTKTGTSFTYRFNRREARPGQPAPLVFASVLTGPDNQSDYAYMGILRGGVPEGLVSTTRGSEVAADAPSYRALNWYLAHLGDARVEFRHEGRCGRCGRALTVPSSIDSGLGPECAGKV